MVNLRDSDIKLVDFGSARYIPKAGAKISLKGCPEYLGIVIYFFKIYLFYNLHN